MCCFTLTFDRVTLGYKMNKYRARKFIAHFYYQSEIYAGGTQRFPHSTHHSRVSLGTPPHTHLSYYNSEQNPWTAATHVLASDLLALPLIVLSLNETIKWAESICWKRIVCCSRCSLSPQVKAVLISHWLSSFSQPHISYTWFRQSFTDLDLRS